MGARATDLEQRFHQVMRTLTWELTRTSLRQQIEGLLLDA